MKPSTAKRLHDAITACDELEMYTSDWTRDEFLLTRSLQLITWKLIDLVGEALQGAQELQPSLRDMVPELSGLVNARDRMAYGFGGMDFAVLWDIAVDEVPMVRRRTVDLLREAPAAD